MGLVGPLAGRATSWWDWWGHYGQELAGPLGARAGGQELVGSLDVSGQELVGPLGAGAGGAIVKGLLVHVLGVRRERFERLGSTWQVCVGIHTPPPLSLSLSLSPSFTDFTGK